MDEENTKGRMNMKRLYDLVKAILNDESTHFIENGEVILSGPIEDTLPREYCYELFKPLSDEEICELRKGYRCPFPDDLAEFYRMTNGAFFFGRSISVFGVPLWSAEYKQPVALAFADGHRTKGCPKHRLFFACYNTDPEVQLFFDTREVGSPMHVYASRFGNNDVIAEWPSFEEWLICEQKRYEEQYRNGNYRFIDIVDGVLRSISFDHCW